MASSPTQDDFTRVTLLSGLLALSVFAFMLGVVFLAVKAVNLPPSLFAFIAISYVPAIILHELAHAFTARALGGIVREIKLGLTSDPTGRHWDFRALGFPWELYSIPLGGRVTAFFLNPLRYRTRIVTFVGAGPLVTFIAACGGVGFYFWNPFSIFAIPSLSWAMVNSWLLVGTAIPDRKLRRGRVLETDGYRIRRTLALTDEEVSQKCFLARVALDSPAEKEVMDKLTIEEAITRYASEPDRVASLTHLVDRLCLAKDPRQYQYFDDLISRPEFPSAQKVAFLDNLLTAHLLSGAILQGDRFDHYSQRLLALSGHSLTCQGTRGSVLIDLGRPDEGAAVLREVLEKSESPIDKIFSNIFLAIAEKQKGQLDAAHRYARAAQAVDPNSPALARIADLLAAP